VWPGYCVEGYYDKCWLTELWSTQAKVEGIMLKAAWHWGSDSSVVTIPLGNQAAPHCMYAFHPRGALWMVTKCFFLFFMGGLLIGTPQI
jgi:hypothetical protein